jgi:glutathione S-transferase
MLLIGMLDSPYVRRVAITARFLKIPYEHRALSVFRDYDAFRKINPLVKVPTLICDDGEILVDSTLIIDYLESIAPAGRSRMPQDPADRVRALQIIGVALVVMEKVVALVYEFKHRPEEKQHAPWVERVDQQLRAALDRLESFAAANAGKKSSWLFGSDMMQADITMAVTWRFVQHIVQERIAADDYPALQAFSERAEKQAEFIACPLS